MLQPIRTKDTNCSRRFIDCGVADVFLLLAAAGKREREDGLLGMVHSFWSRVDVCGFVDRSPNLPGVIP